MSDADAEWVRSLYRALGASYEQLDRQADARVAYERFLELAPAAADRAEIQERMTAMDAPSLARTVSEVELD